MLLEKFARIELLDGSQQLRRGQRGAVQIEIGRGQPLERTGELWVC